MIDLTIRRARNEDTVAIVAMGRDFLLSGPYREHLADRPEAAAKLAAVVLDSEAVTVLVAADKEDRPRGVLAFVVFPHYFSGEQTAGELIWYVEPEYRAGGWAMKLLWEAERLAKEGGSVAMQFTAPHGTEVGAIYERFGYKPVELTYQRRLV